MVSHMRVDRSACMYCGTCVGACPENAITLFETRIEFSDKLCTNCAICTKACPVGAIYKNEAAAKKAKEEKGRK